MRNLKARRSSLPSLWAIIVLALCVAASLLINFRASAQTQKPGTPAQSGTRAPASKPEDNATIQDDPTLVPDDKESADNNITFPIDI